MIFYKKKTHAVLKTTALQVFDIYFIVEQAWKLFWGPVLYVSEVVQVAQNELAAVLLMLPIDFVFLQPVGHKVGSSGLSDTLETKLLQRLSLDL